LLEGLEITIITKSEILKDNTEFRIDSEYYKKVYLQLYKKIYGSPILENLVFMSDLSTNGSFATVASIIHDNNPKVIPFIRSGNTGDTFINHADLEYISKEAHDNLPKSTTHLHDIMMARKGKIGGASIIMQEEVNFNCNENVIKIDIKNKTKINPFYFTGYFNCKYGKKQVERLSTGNVQPWVSIFQIRKLFLFVPSKSFQHGIEELIIKSHFNLQSSKYSYFQAQTLLLETLGLNNFEPTAEAVNVKSFKESFLSSGRLDAEYYQKKYEEITAHIKSHKYEQLVNLVDIKKSIEPGSDAYQEKGVPFIRVSNLNKMGLSEPDIHLDGVKYKDVVKPRKDTILLSKDGSVGIAYKVTEDMNVITSGAILHLSVKTDEILPDYLTLVLNSKVVQMQAERDAGGSILQHWKPSQIEQVEIPIIDKSIQEKIASLVSESFTLKKQSEQLLETAKRAVEIAIEEGEEVALQYIQQYK